MKKITFLLLVLMSTLSFSQGGDCSNPIVIGALPYNTSDNTANYGDDYENGSSPCSSYYMSGDDVFYTYTPVSNENINVTLSGISGTYSGIHILDGCVDTTPNCVAFEGNSGSGDRVLTNIALSSGVTYYIVISTWASPQSITYTLDVSLSPTDTPDWYNIQWLSDGVNGSNTSLTVDAWTTITGYAQVYEDGVTNPAGEAAGFECWFGAQETDSDPSTWAEGDWISATYLGDVGNNDEYSLDVELDFSGTVYVAARWRYNGGPFVYGGYNGPWDGTTNNSIELISNPIVANDNCDSAEALTVNADLACGTVTSGTIELATDSGVYNCSGTEDDDVWYSFVATSDTHVVDLINVAGSTTDLYHAVYDATPGCGALGSALTCSDPNTSTTTGLTVGNTYFVQVYTWTGTSGQTTTFDICIGTPPPPAPGEICSNPIVVSSLPFNTTDDTANYGDDYSGSPGASGCGTTSSYLNGDDVVYAYTASSDTSINVTMSSIGSTYSGIFVYTDCADIGTACIAGEGNSGSSDRSFDVTVTNGTTYYIVISTWASPQSTTYTLDITENTCTNASVTNTVVDDCASSGGFFINVEVTDMGTATALTVSNSQDATTFPVTIPSTVQFGPYVNGTDIVITVVDDNDANCTQSSNTLTQSVCPPSNDDCSGASVLILETGIADAASATSTASTIEGSTDSGLPAEQCGSFTGTANDDVWYVFEAFTTDVNITVDDGATFIDLVIQAYSGSCGTLTNIGCADGGNPEEVQLSGLTVGEMYYFRVYQYSGSSSTTGKDIDIKLWTSSTLSLDDYQFEGFAYYPNPVTNNLTLRAQKDIQNIAVYNMLGQEVLRTAPNALDSVVDMSALSSSAYFVKVTIDNTSETIRIIKN